MAAQGNCELIEILLVEDNPADVRLTEEAFAMGECKNHLNVVTDGDAAISFLQKTNSHSDAPRPALILLDLNLPRKSGSEVLQIIKQDPDLKAIPVIILSSSTLDNDISKAYTNHANCYISKPVDFEQFLKVVSHIETFWMNTVRLPGGQA